MDGGGSPGQKTTHMILGCILLFNFISSGVHGGRSVLQTFGEDSQLSQVTDSTELQQAEEESKVRTHENYSLGPKITDWDFQRAEWLQENPGMRYNRKGRPRMVLVTSSQSEACPSHAGDHYLLKFLKNKIDYARIHDVDIYYNMVVFDKRMKGFFIKLPLIRKHMLTHPEAEWIWWMDSDAVFTDMSFEIPLKKYRDHNMIVPGWESEVYQKRNWMGLNAGIFLLRNCQWSLDLLDIWAALGEDYADNRQNIGALLSKELSGDRQEDFPVDDQSALIYLLTTTHTAQLKPKVFLENSYDLHGYWPMSMEKIEAKFKDFPRGTPGGKDWSFITHFVGCKPCDGAYASYSLDTCLQAMERAYNLADNQVLRIFGYEHEDLSSPHVLRTRPVDSDAVHAIPGHFGFHL